MSEDEKPLKDLPNIMSPIVRTSQPLESRLQHKNEEVVQLIIKLDKLEIKEILAITFRSLIVNFFINTNPYDNFNVSILRIFFTFWNNIYNKITIDPFIAHQYHFIRNDYYNFINELFSAINADTYNNNQYRKIDQQQYNEKIKITVIDLIIYLFNSRYRDKKAPSLLMFQLSFDINSINNRTNYIDLLKSPLLPRYFDWSGCDAPFVKLANNLLDLPSHNWRPWFEWMMARKNGHPDPFGLSPEATKRVEIAVVKMDASFWKKGPPAVNAEFVRLIEEERLKEKAQTEEAPEISDQTILEPNTASVKAKNGKLILQNAELIKFQCDQFVALIDCRIAKIEDERPNDLERKEAEIAELRRQAQDAAKLKNIVEKHEAGLIKEAEAVKKTNLLIQGIQNWWAEEHVKATDQMFKVGIISVISTIGFFCGGGPAGLALAGVVVGGKTFVDSIKATTKLVKEGKKKSKK